MTKPLYFYNGTTFEQVGPTTPQSPIAYQTSAPTGPATGDLWIDSDGDVDTYNRQLTRYYFVATAGQTTISGVDANSLTLAYVAGSEAVYVNGALQVRGQDYTATNGTSVVMTSALAVNDVVEIFAYTAFTVANAYTKSETDGLVGTSAGLKLLTPTTVAVGSGTASVSTTGKVTFTTVSSVSLNDIFSATYDNYKFVLNLDSTSSTSHDTVFRLRVGGADLSSASYNGSVIILNSASSVSGSYSATRTSWGIADAAIGQGVTYFMEIGNPFRTTGKHTALWNNWGLASGNDSAKWYSGQVAAGTSYTGFSIVNVGTGTLTGSISVYGYKV